MAIKKHSKVKFTLRKELIFILAAIILLVVATILLNLPNAEEQFVSKWTEAGSTITENTLYEEVSFDDLDSKLTEGEYHFVFFATPSDANSVTYFDTIISIASLYKEVKKVYIVDCAFAMGTDREEDADFDAKLAQYEEKYGVSLDSTPSFWVFNGNTLVDTVDNYKINEEISWATALTQMFTFAFAN